MSKANDDKAEKIVTEIARSLAYAGDLLSCRYPDAVEIDEAFVEIVVCWFILRYQLTERFHRQVTLPRMLASPKFERIAGLVMQRIDEIFPAQESRS